MKNPLFWLGVSVLLVAMSLTVVLIALLPAMYALARAAQSLEKLADTLNRDLPPTLEALRLTGLEISELTDDITEGVQSAGEVVKQVDETLNTAKQQAEQVQITTRSVFTGLKVAWKTLISSPIGSPKISRLPPGKSAQIAPQISTTQKKITPNNPPKN